MFGLINIYNRMVNFYKQLDDLKNHPENIRGGCKPYSFEGHASA